MRKVTQDELNVMIYDHEFWLDSSSEHGKPLWCSAFGPRLDFSGLDFSNRNLSWANFRYCKMVETNFNRTNLSNVCFEGAICRYANFHEAILWKINFHKSDFSKANFQRSYLLFSRSFEVDFTDADFTDAILPAGFSI